MLIIGIFKKKMLTCKFVFILDVPNQKSFVVGFSVVLLYRRTGIPNSALLVEDLIGLVYISKKTKVKIIKDAKIIFSVLHHPSKIRLAIRNGTMVQGNVNLIRFRGVNPIISIEDR